MVGQSAEQTATMEDSKYGDGKTSKLTSILGRKSKGSSIKKPFKWNKNDQFQHFPFWCGYLPDRDTRELLRRRNFFILRCLAADDSLCVSVAIDDEDNFINVRVIKDNKRHGYYLQSEEFVNVQPTIKELIEFYWCTRIPIISGKNRVRLEVPVQKPNWLFSDADLLFVRRLGEGAYGVVYEAQLIDVSKLVSVAVKSLFANLPTYQLEAIWNEARIMRGLHHRNIVSFFGITNDEKPFSLVMEFVNGPSVQTYLQTSGANIDNNQRTHILVDVCRGMEYMHSQSPPCLHLDLACRNLLISWYRSGMFGMQRKMVVKITDFGMSKKGKKYRIDTEKPLNIRWIAFGVTIFEVFVRPYRIPYPKWTPEQVYEKIIAAKPGKRMRLDRPEGMPVQIFKIMKMCMQLDERRDARPGFGELEILLEKCYYLVDV